MDNFPVIIINFCTFRIMSISPSTTLLSKHTLHILPHHLFHSPSAPPGNNQRKITIFRKINYIIWTVLLTFMCTVPRTVTGNRLKNVFIKLKMTVIKQSVTPCEYTKVSSQVTKSSKTHTYIKNTHIQDMHTSVCIQDMHVSICRHMCLCILHKDAYNHREKDNRPPV